MADLFWAYWDASIRFGLLAGILILTMPVLKRLMAPRLLCWAWAILMLRLALPLSLPFSGSIFNVYESLQPSVWTEAIRKGVVNSGMGETILPAFKDEDSLILDTRIDVSWEVVMMAVWALGAAFLAVRLSANILRLRLFFKKARRCESGPLYDIFKDTIARMGVYSNVPLMISDQVKSPGIAGVFNPRIIIPERCVKQLSDKELQCVFMHELTHYRRGDLFLHHALLLICYVHWYNPLVWIALRQFTSEMEKACDLEVVDSVCAGSASDYGFTLLQVLRLSKQGSSDLNNALALLGSRSFGGLKERIELIAKPKKRGPVLTGAGVLVFAGSFLTAITGEVDPHSESKRLVKLTRFSDPFTEDPGFDLKEWGYEGVVARDIPFSKEHREWVQILDASMYAGKRVQIRADFQFSGSKGAFDLWCNIDDLQNRSLNSSSTRIANPTEGGKAVLTLSVPEEAAKLIYGIRFHGMDDGRLSGLEIEILEDTGADAELENDSRL